MPLMPEILLQGQVPSISPLTQGFAQFGQQRRLEQAESERIAREQPLLDLEQRLLAARVGQAEELMTPEAVEQRQLQRQVERLSLRDQRRLGDIIPAAKQLKTLMAGGDLVGARLFAEQRMADLQRRQAAGEEVDDVETASFLRTLDDSPEQAEAILDQVLKFEGVAGTKVGTKAFAPVTIVNKEGEKRLVSPTVDPNTGQATLAEFDIPEGFEISTETPEEKRAADVVAREEVEDIKVAAEKKKKLSSGQIQRAETLISEGLDAADGFANIQRGLDLLDLVQTGGVKAASLRAKQLFGVEGANEAELSNRMGKAVLSQLRATFGAAFTAQEGASLERIEAGFGKSTEGNRRLLEQTKRLIERKARRGIRAAERIGDKDTVQDIKDSLEFRFDSGEPQPVSQPNVGRFTIEVVE